MGVTGHRLEALEEHGTEALIGQLRTVLVELRAAITALHHREMRYFSDCAPRLLFASPLADGADQIAAEIAVELGFELQAILPFDRRSYRETLHQSAVQQFDRLLARTSCVLELPGLCAAQRDAFVMAGRATVAHSDIIIALWDGLPARGRGGTADVVELALTRGTPVIHVPVAAGSPTVLRWSAFDPSVITHGADPAVERSFTPANLDQMLAGLFSPPRDDNERQFIAMFQSERHRRWRTRIEYPLLLSASGVSRLRASAWRGDQAAESIRREWQSYCTGCWEATSLSNPLAPLEQWYRWSDSLAAHFAQCHRSGHVFNFLLAALAVLLALAALPYPSLKPALAATEFVVIVSILANTWVGKRQEWHRRWLDYRQLAERLRPMRSLKLLGIAAPDAPGTAANPVPRRWVEWYSAAVWRAVGFPSGQIRAEQPPSIAQAVAAHELRPQIDYHRRLGDEAHAFDGRLEAAGLVVFGATLLSIVALLVAMLVSHDWAIAKAKWFTIIAAGLPAIGTAIYGIRVQGGYANTAARSQQTAQLLEQVAERLESERPDLRRAADHVEQGARLMVADLEDWALLNQKQDLSVG